MTYESPDEAMQSLVGHVVSEWGRDDGDGGCYHITMDDGRILVFIGLGIYLPNEHALH